MPRLTAVLIALVLSAGAGVLAGQTSGVAEEFSAFAIANNNVATGAGAVIIRINRWSTDGERERLVQTLREKGPQALLDALRDTKPVGTIRTPDSLGYDLHYAHEVPGEDGGRQIVIATDRPIGYWEAVNRPRTIEYPFTVIQMQIGKEGEGKGTLSYFTRIQASGNIIALEDYANAPIMLNQIKSRKIAK